jgi:polysaccharide biosynthesis/export protein
VDNLSQPTSNADDLNGTSSNGNATMGQSALNINYPYLNAMQKPPQSAVELATQQRLQGDVEKNKTFENIEVIGEGPRYTIGSGDILRIMVRNQPEFTGRFVVNEDGFIQYNWVGDVKVAGLTKEELNPLLVDKLQKYVRYPEVSILIEEYNSKFVYVLGDVQRPGKYPMKGDKLTLREALILSGLPTDKSAMKRTRIVRETEKGPKSIKVNLKDILLNGKLDKNYDLMPGDIIVVPTSTFHKVTDSAYKVTAPLFHAMAIYELGWGSQDEGGIFGKKK